MSFVQGLKIAAGLLEFACLCISDVHLLVAMSSI